MSNSYLENRFCVYLHKDKEGIVRYVGHGTMDRPYILSKNHRSKKWWDMFPDGNPDVVIVKDGLTKHSAIDYEIELFHKYEDSIVNKHKPSKVLELDYSLFDEWFYVDETSPSGLRWKKKPTRSKFLKDSQAGSILTTEAGKKYWQITLLYRVYKVHRIVYLLSHGETCVDKVVDHIDSNGLNNKIKNLRLVNFKDNSTNMKNVSSTGIHNLHEHKCKGKSRGYIVKWCSRETGKSTVKLFSFSKFGSVDQTFKAACNFRQSLIDKGDISNITNEIPYNSERQ